MGNLAFSNMNAALADPTVARGIVLAAATALDAVTAAGVQIDQVEQEFLRNIPPVVWTQLQTAILAAYAAGQQITLSAGSVGAYSVDPKPAVNGAVEVVINGPYPTDRR